MRTWKDVGEAIRAGHTIVVQFTKAVLEQEGYLEPGMRGKLIAFSEEDDTVVKFTVDLTDFEAYNRAFESSTYWDRQGKPTLTAREAGHYPKDNLESLWADETSNVSELAEIVSDEGADLYKEFRATGVTDILYITWLENQVRALRASMATASTSLADAHPSDWGLVVAQQATALKTAAAGA